MTRPNEITQQFLAELDKHMLDLKSGKAEFCFEIRHIASIMHIHPTHLSNMINEELKKSPCDIYEEMLLDVAKELILSTELSIAAIARQLTFDPSNFGKFFKHFVGITPKQFRDSATIKQEPPLESSELVTMIT
jgi:AraC-like DNA-binding protein